MISTRTGLSPTMVQLSRRFRFLHNCHWPGPRSLVTTEGVSVDVLSSGYLDISVHRVRLYTLCIQVQIPRINTKLQVPGVRFCRQLPRKVISRETLLSQRTENSAFHRSLITAKP